MTAWKWRKLFLNTTTCDKHWQQRYFFVQANWGQYHHSLASRPVLSIWNLNFGEALDQIEKEWTCAKVSNQFFFFFLDRLINQELKILTSKEQTFVLLLGKLTLSLLSLKKLLFEEQLVANQLRPNPKDIPIRIPYPCVWTNQGVKTWLSVRRCVYIFWGPIHNAWSHIWPDLSPELIQAMENKTVFVKASVSKIQRKAKAFQSKKRAKKEGRLAKKAASRTLKAMPLLAEQQIVVANQGKWVEINSQDIDMTVEGQAPVPNRAKL